MEEKRIGSKHCLLKIKDKDENRNSNILTKLEVR
jgi:hypothetical protein